MVDTNELRELLARAATECQWECHDGPEGWNHQISAGILGVAGVHASSDAALIVAAVNTLPALLDELDRLRALEARVNGAPTARVEWQQHVGMVVGSCRLSSALIGKRVALLRPAGDGEGGERGRG